MRSIGIKKRGSAGRPRTKRATLAGPRLSLTTMSVTRERFERCLPRPAKEPPAGMCARASTPSLYAGSSLQAVDIERHPPRADRLSKRAKKL